MLQFEKEVGMVERLTDEGQLCGVHSGRVHEDLMRSERGRMNEGKAKHATAYASRACQSLGGNVIGQKSGAGVAN
jgi:hypothetical protein